VGWVKNFLVLILPILVTGCIAIPLPPEKHQFTKTMEQQIEVRKTTRDEIIKSFGEPELAHSNTLLIYRLPRESMKLFIIVGGAGGGAMGVLPIKRSDYVLLMEFDSTGTLKKYEALIHKSNTYETIINPVPPKIADTERTKIFNFDKNETDFFFWKRTIPIGITKLAFSSGGKSLAVVGREKDSLIDSIYWINLETNESKLLQEDIDGTPLFSPDIAKVSFRQGTAMMVLETNTSATVFKKDKGFWGMSVFTVVAFNGDGSLIAAGDNNGETTILDYSNGKELFSFKNEKDVWIDSVAFSKDSRWLATVSDDNNLTIWDAKTGILLDSRKGASGSIEFSPSNNLFAINAKDHVELWQIRESESPRVQLIDIFTLPGQVWDSWPKPSDYSLAFSQDGKYVAARNGSVVVYNIAKRRKVIQYSKSIDNQASFESVNCIAFSPDGKSVVGGTSTGIYSWRLPDEKVLQP
jgi:outer membrane protein assembly factor BamB